MSTHNIQFHHKIRTFPKYLFFWSYRKNFVGTKNEFELAMVNEPSVFEPLGFYYCFFFFYYYYYCKGDNVNVNQL